MYKASDLFPNLGEDEVDRIDDHFPPTEDESVYKDVRLYRYITLASWIAIHEMRAFMGYDEDAGEILDKSDIQDYDCHRSGVMILSFSEIEDVQKMHGFCGGDNYCLNSETGRFEAFDPGFPVDHPTIEQQIETSFRKYRTGYQPR